METDKITLWPISFDDIAANPPPSLTVRSAVLDPVLRITRNGLSYVAELGAYYSTRSTGRVFLKAATVDCNWAAGHEIVYPLPINSGDVVRSILGGRDPLNLSFPDVLYLRSCANEELTVEIDDAAMAPAAELSGLGALPPPPEGLNATLYDYQARGIAWMSHVSEQLSGFILADEMGLGKTLQILALLLKIRPSPAQPALIICPTTLIANWQRETERFAPSLSILVHRGALRATLPRHLLGKDIVISTYDTVVNDLVLFKAVNWSWMICDEAQALKNPDSLRRRSIAQIPRARTVPMTGTPVETHLVDLWSLTDLAIPGLLGSRGSFDSKFPDTEASATSLAALTAPLVLKRRVSDVAQDLPDRIDVVVPLELGPELADAYEAVRLETIASYPVAGSMVATGQLQIFCAHQSLLRIDSSTARMRPLIPLSTRNGTSLTPKLMRTIEIILEAFSNGRKVLIFSNYNQCESLVKNALSPSGDVYWNAINGSTPQEDRQAIVDQFSSHAGNALLVLNPKAAGSGLNITAATVVIHYTQVWNPALEAQASARAHRRGQKEPVTVYHLYYISTVEEVMLQRAQERRELGEEAIPNWRPIQDDISKAMTISPIKDR